MTDLFLWFFLLLHILCCLILAALTRPGILKAPAAFVLCAFFLPVWGEISVLMLHFMCVRKKTGTKQSEVEVQRFDGSGRPHLEADVHDTSFIIPSARRLPSTIRR